MSLTVVLSIGFDPWFLEAHRPAWRSAGFFITSAGSAEEAIDQFSGGDFDLVIVGDTLPAKSREGVASLIRASGSRIPVVCVTDSCGPCGAFTDLTIEEESLWLLKTIRELLARSARRPVVKADEIKHEMVTRVPDFPGSVKTGTSSVQHRAGWVTQARSGIGRIPILPNAKSPCFTGCLQNFGL